MTAAVAVVAGLTPGVFWLWVFTRGKSYRAKPRRLLVISFFLGMLSVIPAGFIEWLAIPDDWARVMKGR